MITPRDTGFITRSQMPPRLRAQMLRLTPQVSATDYAEMQRHVAYYDQQMARIERGEFRLTEADLQLVRKRRNQLAVSHK